MSFQWYTHLHKYGVVHIANVFDNPLCAIHARIDYVQRAEPRTGGYDPG